MRKQERPFLSCCLEPTRSKLNATRKKITLVGGLCLIGGGEFLNYADLEIPGLEVASRRYLGILLTQIGVAVDVAVTAISIVLSLSSNHEDEDSHA